ncbi:MAG TPA: hypothetical protein VFS95_09095 [Telluria sp.]|nr:hypothetical protein [Telluria sp.]
MKIQGMRIALLATMAASVLMTGCATPADTAAQPQEKADKEYATGSRLPVRKPATPAPAVDKT